jgi:hypothetical protein
VIAEQFPNGEGSENQGALFVNYFLKSYVKLISLSQKLWSSFQASANG